MLYYRSFWSSGTSQPAKAVWIEILPISSLSAATDCHSLRRLCGLKCHFNLLLPLSLGHSLRRLCGLKYLLCCLWQDGGVCHSLRRLCGLKLDCGRGRDRDGRSQPAKAVWIEICLLLPRCSPDCHSLRRLCGLKFLRCLWVITVSAVTACEGCVD